MRKLTIITFICFTLFANAQKFQLQTSDGILTGPFNLKHDSTVTIGTNTATIVKSQRDQVLETLDNIIIPEVDFQQASIHVVVDFMQKVSAEFDTQKRSVSFILNLASCSTNRATTVATATAGTEAIHPITLSALKISLLDLLNYAADIANMKYMIVGHTVMIAPPNAPTGKIFYRIYDFMLNSNERAFSNLKQAQRNSNNHIKEYFADMGVLWPVGSSVKYLSDIEKLVVANTKDNLDMLEYILYQISHTPAQIEVEISFVAFDLAQLSQLGPNGITSDSLMSLWRNGDAELLAAPRVLAQSGAEATSKGVTEYIYPTDFSVHISSTNTNTTVIGSVVEPRHFETREVGAIVNVIPELTPDGTMIYVTLAPELVESPEWKDYGASFTDSNGIKQKAYMPQPFFHTYSLTSTILVANNHTVLIGGGMPTRDQKCMVYTFLTVKLIGIRGEPIKTEMDIKKTQ